MIRIPTNVILIWTGTNASIPSLWSRETTLDGKFPKAWGSENPNTTGGASTHTHTSPAHSHTMVNHTHTYTLSTVSPTGNSTRLRDAGGDALRDAHDHQLSTSGAVSGGTTSSDAITYEATSNNPPYHEVIFIKASAGAVLNTDMVGLWSQATVPTNWIACDGGSSSPDLRNKYLRGASTGGDAGTLGGGYINTHGITHTHSATNHSHVASPSAIRHGGTENDGGGLAVNAVHKGHSHSVPMDNTSIAPPTYSDSLVTAETVEPAYTKLLAIQRKTGGKAEKGLIGLWLGTVASIPAGWIICDGNNGTPNMQDRFLKIANDTSEIGNTGGSNTHTHSAQSHTHGTTDHTHTATCPAHVAGQNDNPGGSAVYAPTPAQTPTHLVQNVSTATASWDSALTTADSSANQPEYRTCVYIYLQKPVDPKPKILEV